MLGRSGCTRALALGVAATLAAGCFSTSIRVVQRVPVDRTRDRVYVLVYEGAAPACYARRMSSKLTDALVAHATARKSSVLTGLEFDTRGLERDVDAFGARGVLTIKPIGARTGRYGEIVALIYGATFEDRASNQPLWAAKVEIDGSTEWGIGAAADEIAAALADDHLIPPAYAPR